MSEVLQSLCYTCRRTFDGVTDVDNVPGLVVDRWMLFSDWLIKLLLISDWLTGWGTMWGEGRWRMKLVTFYCDLQLLCFMNQEILFWFFPGETSILSTWNMKQWFKNNINLRDELTNHSSVFIRVSWSPPIRAQHGLLQTTEHWLWSILVRVCRVPHSRLRTFWNGKISIDQSHLSIHSYWPITGEQMEENAGLWWVCWGQKIKTHCGEYQQALQVILLILTNHRWRTKMLCMCLVVIMVDQCSMIFSGNYQLINLRWSTNKLINCSGFVWRRSPGAELSVMVFLLLPGVYSVDHIYWCSK